MKLDQIPMCSGGGLLGHAGEFRDRRLSFLARIGREGGDICRLRFFAKQFLFVNEPGLLHELFVERAVSQEKSFGVRTSLYPLVGEGLFNAEGDLWKRQRKLMAFVFQPASLVPFADMMAGCAARVSARWRDGVVVDVTREMTNIAMAVAGKVLFGIDVLDETDELAQALTTVLDWTSFAMTSMPLIVQQQLQAVVDDVARLPRALRGLGGALRERLRSPVLFPGARTRELQKALGVLDGRVQRMIDERRASGEIRHDLLGRLLAARDEGDGAGMNDKQVRDEILTLFVAGHETSAATFTWTLYLLSQHPEIRRRVEDEARSLPAGLPWEAKLPKLGCMLRAIKESMRLYPPVYISARRAVRDMRLGPYELPRGVEILLSPYALHRRPDRWAEPDRFDPDRFLPAAEARRPRGSYLPFLMGPRVCIGQHFALMEAQVVLSTLLERASFSLAPGVEVEPVPSTILRASPAPMRVQRVARGSA